jgi:membrane protein YdbS with pleckstrin-like domain
MTGDVPGSADPGWQDRETESIPRARTDQPPPPPPPPYPPHGADFDDAPGPGGFLGPPTPGASFSIGEPLSDEPLTEDEFAGVRGGVDPSAMAGPRVLPLEDEASKLVQRYLFPTEKFRGEWRRHPIQLAKEIALAGAATVLLGLATGYLTKNHAAPGITTILVLGWIAVMLWVAWQIADWWYDRFILTNKRVMVVSGIITRNVAMMPLLRVTDMKYVQSPIGRLFNYGTFELESAGQEQALRSITNLPNPNDLYLRIVEEMYEPEAVEARLAGAGVEASDDGT